MNQSVNSVREDILTCCSNEMRQIESDFLRGKISGEEMSKQYNSILQEALYDLTQVYLTELSNARDVDLGERNIFHALS